MTGPQPKSWISAIDAYVPGKSTAGAGARTVKLSANETPFGASPKAQAAFAACASSLHRYPLGPAPALRERLAAFHGIEGDRIICGCGSDEILGLIAQAFAGPGDEIIHVRHGFMVYPIAARRVGALPVAAPDRNLTADVDALLASVTDKTKVVFLANPNNPTGTDLPAGEIARLHRELPRDVVLVIDEAYVEYVNRNDAVDGLALARDAENILVTRTFSKIHGLAAARIGWGYGAPGLIEAMQRIRPPFNVSDAAEQAALAALDDRDWVATARAHNDQWRPWLAAEIAGLGLEVVPSQANFLLIRFPETEGVTAQAANRHLLSRGYILRWLPNQGLGDCLRLTVGLAADNRAVVSELAGFLKDRR